MIALKGRSLAIARFKKNAKLYNKVTRVSVVGASQAETRKVLAATSQVGVDHL